MSQGTHPKDGRRDDLHTYELQCLAQLTKMPAAIPDKAVGGDTKLVVLLRISGKFIPDALNDVLSGLSKYLVV